MDLGATSTHPSLLPPHPSLPLSVSPYRLHPSRWAWHPTSPKPPTWDGRYSSPPAPAKIHPPSRPLPSLLLQFCLDLHYNSPLFSPPPFSLQEKVDTEVQEWRWQCRRSGWQRFAAMFFPTACCDGGKGRGGKEKKRGVDVWKQKKREKKVCLRLQTWQMLIRWGLGLDSYRLSWDTIQWSVETVHCLFFFGVRKTAVLLQGACLGLNRKSNQPYFPIVLSSCCFFFSCITNSDFMLAVYFRNVLAALFTATNVKSSTDAHSTRGYFGTCFCSHFSYLYILFI